MAEAARVGTEGMVRWAIRDRGFVMSAGGRVVVAARHVFGAHSR